MEEDKSIKIRKIGKKVIKYVSYSFLLLLMLIASCLIFFAVTTKIYESNGKNPPFGLYTIASSSMEPEIMTYDVVFVRKIDPEKLKVDDVITFYSSNPFFGNTPITHRIYEIVSGEELMFITKGDANKIPDEDLVITDNILGKVCFKFSGLGKVQFFLASKEGILVAVLIPAVIIIIYDIYKITKAYFLRKRMKEIEKLENN